MPQTPPTSEPLLDASLLCSQSPGTIKPGLQRMHRLLAALGNPHVAVPIIHVAGTNGKGSVCKLLESILGKAGYAVATTTSPHLQCITERITHGGQAISVQDWQVCQSQLASVASGLPTEEKPTYFEAVMLLAFLAFRHWVHTIGLDVAIVETGLGGRLDASNVVDAPLLTVITSIGVDHTEFLGDTVAQIAAEKAGIIKPSVPLVVGPALPADAFGVVTQQAAALACPVRVADNDRLTTVSTDITGQQVADTTTGQRYTLPLLGPYQQSNLATTLAAIETLQSLGWVIPAEAVAAGVAAVRHGGRGQILAEQCLLVDGSHNADGWAALAQTLQCVLPNEPLHLLLAVKATKPLAGLTHLLSSVLVARVTCTAGPTSAGPYYTAQALRDVLIQQAPLPASAIHAEEAFPQAWQQFNQRRAPAGGLAWGVVTGSLHLCGSILNVLE